MLARFKGLSKLFGNRTYFATPAFKFSSAAEGESNAENEIENQEEETHERSNIKSPSRLRKAAIVLSGSGAYDGSEITETVSFLISLSARKISFQCYAPNKDQSEVINHLTGQPINTTRNVLVESARIARGKVKDIKELQATEYDAVFFPGGFGAAKNLSTFATKGADMTVDPEVERVLRDFHQNRKAIGLTCIAPMLAAKVFAEEKKKVGITLGAKGDKWPYQDSIDVAEQLGAKHFNKPVSKTYVDTKNLVFTTPAFMRDTTDFSEIYEGIDNFVATVETQLKAQRALEADEKRKEKEKKREAKQRKAEKKAAKKAEKQAAKQAASENANQNTNA